MIETRTSYSTAVDFDSLVVADAIIENNTCYPNLRFQAPRYEVQTELKRLF